MIIKLAHIEAAINRLNAITAFQMTKEIYTRRQGKTTIKPGQYLIVDARGVNLEVTNRISSGAFVTLFKMDNQGNLNRFNF